MLNIDELFVLLSSKGGQGLNTWLAHLIIFIHFILKTLCLSQDSHDSTDQDQDLTLRAEKLREREKLEAEEVDLVKSSIFHLSDCVQIIFL